MGAASTFSFAVLSGKGGVGKSCLALNTCCCLHRMGHRTLLAVRQQRPLVRLSPSAPAACDCMAVAHGLQRMRQSRLTQGSLPEPLGPAPLPG